MHTIPNDVKAITTETTFLLPGPAGSIETLLSPYPDAAQNTLAVICHPHPLYGGTMHNKVITTIAKAFQEVGIQTIRFNFRGVGQSAGSFANGEGEQDDLLAILDWVKHTSPNTPLWLAGFSFGAYIALRTAPQLSLAGLITIAPPINHFPLNAPPRITCPWILAQGEQDDIVPTPEVLTWIKTLTPPPQLLLFPTAGHFFHGKLTELKQALINKIQP